MEVAGGVGECVDLELGQGGFGDFGEEPVHDAATFDAALAVQDKDDFFGAGGLEGLFEDNAAGPDVSGAVIEVALNEAFDEVEDNAFPGSVEVVLVCKEKNRGIGAWDRECSRWVLDSCYFTLEGHC